ncbi:hypothetical protein [Carboxylicivirga taeanensis]|uniref:hypothetical protein n=1 Tax=Carboxylicivirga taeanensis TaxID=1416875 RepID=UPI003F6E4046
MDDIGNILYVLAMVAALVFSAFKKQKQAKKDVTLPSDPPTYHPMDEEDIVDELRELYQKPKPKKQEPVVEKRKGFVSPFANDQRFAKAQEAQKAKKKPLKVEVLEEEGEDLAFDKEQIDLRQAVIYSEILKRPYE